MELRTNELGDCTVVAPVGSLDATSATTLRARLHELVDGGAARQVIVDMSEVPFVDSAGLSALVSTLKRARDQGGDIRLCGLVDAVRSVFEITRLHRVFDVFDDVRAATSV